MERSTAEPSGMPTNSEEAQSFEERLNTVEQILERGQMGRATFYEEVKAGRLRTIKRGRRRLVPESAFREWVRQLEKASGEVA